MPDWVTHLGTTYIATGMAGRFSSRFGRFLEIRYLLLGALLPDVTRFTVILVDILDWPAVPTFTYLIPFHSLLIVALLSAAIAMLFPAVTPVGHEVRSPEEHRRSPDRTQNRLSLFWRFQGTGLKYGLGSPGGGSGKAFGLIMLGAGGHLLLDDLEGLVGCGSTTFYPFYFGRAISGWNTEGNVATVLLIGSVIAIGVALGRKGRWSPLTLRCSWQRLFGAAILLLVAVIIPLFFRQWMVEQNAYYLGLVANPDAFEGQSVEFCFSEVIIKQPPTIEEFDRPFLLETSLPLTQGEWVSVRGIYREGVIEPTILIRHRGFSDVGLSLLATLAFGFLMVEGQQLRAVLSWLKSLAVLCLGVVV